MSRQKAVTQLAVDPAPISHNERAAVQPQDHGAGLTWRDPINVGLERTVGGGFVDVGLFGNLFVCAGRDVKDKKDKNDRGCCFVHGLAKTLLSSFSVPFQSWMVASTNRLPSR